MCWVGRIRLVRRQSFHRRRTCANRPSNRRRSRGDRGQGRALGQHGPFQREALYQLRLPVDPPSQVRPQIRRPSRLPPQPRVPTRRTVSQTGSCHGPMRRKARTAPAKGFQLSRLSLGANQEKLSQKKVQFAVDRGVRTCPVLLQKRARCFLYIACILFAPSSRTISLFADLTLCRLKNFSIFS